MVSGCRPHSQPATQGPGLDAVADQYGEAVLAAADVLRDVRAGQAPEAAAYTYDSTEPFLAEFSTGAADAGGSHP